MRITVAMVAMVAITFVAMSFVFGDNVLPFSLNLPQVVADPVEEPAPAVTSSTSMTTSSVVQTQSLTQEGMFSKGYAGAGCSSGIH